MNEELKYVAFDGKYYLESPGENGEFEYEPAEEGLTFQALPSGKFIAVRDQAEAARQRESASHLKYFQSLSKDGNVHHAMRRQDALQRKLEQLVVDRVMPGAHPDVRVIKDGEFLRLTEEYRRAVSKGEAKQSDFQPFQAYAHKLTTRSGKVLRPVLKGEVGMRGSQILVLEAGYGEGTQVSVASIVKEG